MTHDLRGRRQSPRRPDRRRFTLRLPEDLLIDVEIAAYSNHRSVNAEFVHRVQQSFECAGDWRASNPSQFAPPVRGCAVFPCRL